VRFGIIILADQRWQDSARRWRLAEEYGFDHSYAITTACSADDQATLSADPDGNQTVPPSGVAAASLTAASCPSTYPAGCGDRTGGPSCWPSRARGEPSEARRQSRRLRTLNRRRSGWG
jgi:hypothetical protein